MNDEARESEGVAGGETTARSPTFRTPRIDDTHGAELRSWVESAQDEGGDFSVQNLPFGVFRHGEARPRIGIAIGDQILDLRACVEGELLAGLPGRLQRGCRAETLNLLMALDHGCWTALRYRGSRLLVEKEHRGRVEPCLVPMSETEMLLPARVGDYTDFYASVFHATNVGRLFRPDNPLLPNYKYIPIGYHGRSSSLVISGTVVHRPSGQLKPPEADEPLFGSCRLLDYELEVGFFVGGATNAIGESVPIESAEERSFGLCLVNDWSARDLQAWEYQPLGPFLAKSFATSVSPWVVTLDALAPYRCGEFERPEGDPRPLEYLRHPKGSAPGFDVRLEVLLSSTAMRDQGIEPFRLSLGSFREMYWTLGQMLTHHSSNGCNLRAGDLIASGTVSGPEPGSFGSLLEITRRGAEPIELPSGEKRAMLEGGDEIILRGHCEREGFARIGLGECRGRISQS